MLVSFERSLLGRAGYLRQQVHIGQRQQLAHALRWLQVVDLHIAETRGELLEPQPVPTLAPQITNAMSLRSAR
jgi:hypothetical protein